VQTTFALKTKSEINKTYERNKNFGHAIFKMACNLAKLYICNSRRSK